MRVPATGRKSMSHEAIVAAALALALCALALLRPGTGTATLAGWSDSPGVPSSQPPIAVGIATPASRATPAPIHARVGLQVGHWQAEELPDELAVLRAERGASAGGYNEVDVNFAIAQQVAAILTARGIAVDILPATIPPGYTADAFVAIHCDFNNDPGMGGFKLAR